MALRSAVRIITRRATSFGAQEKSLKNVDMKSECHNLQKDLLDNSFIPYSLHYASHQLQVGTVVMNCASSKSSTNSFLQPNKNARLYQELVSPVNKARVEGVLDRNSQVGNCMPLADMRIGTWVHCIESKPGQGAKLVRAAGTFAKIIKEPGAQCLVRLPSGVEKVIDSRCRATVGIVSNLSHGARKLRKAGHSRWLGIRPTVRGVAMNPVDHPHGGGEGRTKGGRPSVTPWGKPTKAGYKTASVKRRN